MVEALHAKLNPKADKDDQLLIYASLATLSRSKSAPKTNISVASTPKNDVMEHEQKGYVSKRRSKSLRKVSESIDWDKPYLKFEKRPNDLIEMARTEQIQMKIGQKTRHWGVQVNRKDFGDLREMIGELGYEQKQGKFRQR